MPLGADDFRRLADFFGGLAQSIVIFEENNRAKIDDSQFSSLENLRKAALDYSDHFLLAAIQEMLKDITAPLVQISAATTKINQALQTINDIGKAIAIAAAGVQLGAAIMTGQPAAIAQAVDGVLHALSAGSPAPTQATP